VVINKKKHQKVDRSFFYSHKKKYQNMPDRLGQLRARLVYELTREKRKREAAEEAYQNDLKESKQREIDEAEWNADLEHTQNMAKKEREEAARINHEDFLKKHQAYLNEQQAYLNKQQAYLNTQQAYLSDLEYAEKNTLQKLLTEMSANPK
jgi:hypothetical protein